MVLVCEDVDVVWLVLVHVKLALDLVEVGLVGFWCHHVLSG